MKLGSMFYSVVRISKCMVEWFQHKDADLNKPNTFMHFRKFAQVKQPIIHHSGICANVTAMTWLFTPAVLPTSLCPEQAAIYRKKPLFLNKEMDYNFSLFQTCCKGVCLTYLFEGILKLYKYWCVVRRNPSNAQYKKVLSSPTSLGTLCTHIASIHSIYPLVYNH